MKIIAVMGLGSIGKRHAKNLLTLGHKVYGLDLDASIENEALSWGCSEIPVPFDVATECDGVVVAAPTKDHYDYLRKAVIHGPHCFVEKPISDKIDELPSLLSIARDKGRVIICGNNLRFHSCVIRAKEWLDDELIGKPYAASFLVGQLNTKPYKEDVILNWGAHELDLARYLLGEAMVVSCVGNRDNADIIMQHLPNGCQTTVHLDYLASPPLRGFSIIGPNGRISVDLERRIAQLKKVVNENLFKADSSDSWDENYKDEMRSFIDAIDGKPSVPLATGSDGLATLEMILKAKELAGVE